LALQALVPLVGQVETAARTSSAVVTSRDFPTRRRPYTHTSELVFAVSARQSQIRISKQF
jgi:hypothetical protein